MRLQSSARPAETSPGSSTTPYQAVFPGMRVSRDTDGEIHTVLRGRRYATSIEGTLTGRGGSNPIIIDDPIKPNDAMSQAAREKSIEWYRGTLVTRADDKKNAAIVVVMQCVHQQDPVGYLIEQGDFDVLNLPAIAQSDKGTILHPQHES